jgi:DNA-binding MarR family transcriptional regulator
MADEELVDTLVQLSFTVVARLTQVGAAHDLSLTQLRVLAILTDHQPRMADLADHLGLDRSTVSGLVDRAAARGLLERYADPDDRRSSRVRLTRTGRALARRVRRDVEPWFAELLAPLGARERQSAARALRQLLPG